MHSSEQAAERSSPAGGAACTAMEALIRETDYDEAEACFAALLKTACLDEHVKRSPAAVHTFERSLEEAISVAYTPRAVGEEPQASCVRRAGSAQLFLQRVLYRINRLKLFWHDDLSNYDNERSSYLREVRDRVEGAWQQWEASQLNSLAAATMRCEEVRVALLTRAGRDVRPEPSASGLYFRDEVNEAGYRHLLAIASLDGLVEASQLSRTLGGVSNNIQAVMTRLLIEEYGGGRLNRKHSTFFTAMLTELKMRTEPEAYFDLVPWEVLAGINHSFLLSERKRFYLRYVGGLLHTEISVPAAFDNYRAAAERLGMSEAARGYWELHIREDERHGQWMLHDVALPLAAKYPAQSWEIVLGYDQQRLMSERAGRSVERAVRAAHSEAANGREESARREVAA
jgi:hypothetical protein